MSDLKYIKKILVEYKQELDCKYPYEMNCETNYENLDRKDAITLQLFEEIINILEEKELKDSGFYD